MPNDSPIALLDVMEKHLRQSDEMTRVVERAQRIGDAFQPSPALSASLERMSKIAAAAIAPSIKFTLPTPNVEILKALQPSLGILSGVQGLMRESPVYGLTAEQRGFKPILDQMSWIGERYTSQLLSPQITKGFEGITASIAADMSRTLQLSALATIEFPHLWLGRPSRPRRMGVDEWLAVLRPDLPGKRTAMRNALSTPLEGAGIAAYLAAELLLHLFNLIAPDREVIEQFTGTSMEKEYLVDRDGRVQVVWKARGHFAASRSGLGEEDQRAIATLARAGGRLNGIKHEAHKYRVEDIRPLIEQVDRLLFRLAGRYFPNN